MPCDEIHTCIFFADRLFIFFIVCEDHLACSPILRLSEVRRLQERETSENPAIYHAWDFSTFFLERLGGTSVKGEPEGECEQCTTDGLTDGRRTTDGVWRGIANCG